MMARVSSHASAELIDIRLLRCFDALMGDRSVSHVARRLNISQPSMSARGDHPEHHIVCTTGCERNDDADASRRIRLS
ncbi:MAG: helix-turn-helix domain-containing protein [Burkholderiales bacterium]